MKLGLEVEGRLKGLYTLFLQASEAADFFEYISLKQRAHPHGSADSIEKVRHIYISDHSNTLEANADCLRIWNEIGLPVTIEVTNIKVNRDQYPSNVGFMLTVQDTREPSNYCASFFRMQGTDQVKFSSPKDEHHQVFCVTKENMTVTQPQDFAGDISFEALRHDHFKGKGTNG